MTIPTRVRSWTEITVGGLSLPDLLVAVTLSVGAVISVSRTPGASEGMKVAGSVAVLAMTLPVAWGRRAPVAAAAALAAGAVLNGLLIGSMVRCGAALPAVFIVGFLVASRCPRRPAALGLGLCTVNVLAQTVYDVRLGVSVFPLMLTILCVFFVLGRVARSHAAAVDALRARTAELRDQREQTARMTRLANRARITDDVDAMLSERIAGIAAAARRSRDDLSSDPDSAAAELAVVETQGREVLQQLRRIVGSLDPMPSEPQPALADLSGLLHRATSADARLTVEGSARRLPAGMELTAYRITEHLVAALEDAPAARIDVGLRFEPDAFELRVSGPPAAGVELSAVLAAARERAALYGGTLDGRLKGDLCLATARIPLVTHGG